MYINKAKKIVIKLGSSTVIDKKGNFKKKWLLSLINDIKKLKKISRKWFLSLQVLSHLDKVI